MQTKDLTEFFKNSFAGYCKYSQKSIEPTWNYDEKFYKKVIADLTVFFQEDNNQDLFLEEAPPRSGKTELTTHLGLTWLLTKYTNKRFFVCAGNQGLKRKLRRGILRIINSQFYQEYFNLKCDINNANEILMSNGNLIFFTTTSSEVPTGEGFHFMFFEDYLTKTTIDSQAKLDNAYDQMDGFLSRTQQDPQTKIIINNQRLAFNDLSNRMTSYYNEIGVKYQRLTFPYQFEKYTEYLLPNNEKISFAEGEFLVSRFNENTKNKILARLGRDIFQTQFQQNPTARQGSYIKDEYLQRIGYQYMLAIPFEKVLISCDLSFTDGANSDYNAFTVWGIKESNFYLLEPYRMQADFVNVKRMLRDIVLKWHTKLCIKPTIYIESKANGSALLSEIKHAMPDYNAFPYNPIKKKEDRLLQAMPSIQAKRLYIADSLDINTYHELKMLREFINEILDFPNVKNDDFLDTLTQVINSHNAEPPHYTSKPLDISWLEALN